jgi:ABC-2 type transport system permease protein
MLGWLAGSVVLGVMMGALSQQVIDALQGNPGMADAMGAGGGNIVDGFIAAVQVYLAIIAIGYVVQAIGILSREESEQRVEPRLAGTLSRRRWLAVHAAVVLSGLVIIVVISSVSFGLASAISIGDSGQVATLLRAGLAYLPAELIFAGLALLLFGMFPRLFAISWGAYAVATFIAFLGPGLKLSHWILDLSPTTHVGNPPVGTVPAVSLAVMTVIACALLGGAFVGFRERNIPNN